MVKVEKEDIVNLTLPQIIHKKIKSKLSFEELENFDKGLIIKYIYDNNIQLKELVQIKTWGPPSRLAFYGSVRGRLSVSVNVCRFYF